MSDLLGDDFAELIQERNGKTSLSSRAGLFVPVNEGAVYVWPTALIAAAKSEDFVSEISYIARLISDWDRSIARAGEPLVEFFKRLFLPDVNTCDIQSYAYITRDSMIKSVGHKAVISRLQNQLVEYNILRQLVPNRGPRPAIFSIIYPLVPKEPAKQRVTELSTIDLSAFQKLSPSDESQREQRLLELNRQALHKSRPHETEDEDGNQIRLYKRQAKVRSPAGSLTTIEIIAETYEGSDEAVMTKTDDHVYGHLLSWCLTDLKRRAKLGQPLDDWYVIEPATLAIQLGYANPNNAVGPIRQMMERWKDTRVRAEIVAHEIQGEDDDGEFVQFITQHIIMQFADHKSRYKTMKDGRKLLEALAFKLPDHIQKDLERRALGNGKNELFVQGIASMLQTTSSRTLMTDSFAIAVNNFFWNWARNYWNGWSVDLWDGISEIFDFEFPVIGDDATAQERKRILDISRMRFYRYLERFFTTFTDDGEANMRKFKSKEGGVITIEFPDFTLTFDLRPRSGINQRQSGKVSIIRKAKRIAKEPKKPSAPHLSSPTVHLLEAYKVSRTVAEDLAKTYPIGHVEAAVEVMNNLASTPDNPGGYLVSVIRGNAIGTLDGKEAHSPGTRTKPDSRETRRQVTAAIMDIRDTDW